MFVNLMSVFVFVSDEIGAVNVKVTSDDAKRNNLFAIQAAAKVPKSS